MFMQPLRRKIKVFSILEVMRNEHWKYAPSLGPITYGMRGKVKGEREKRANRTEKEKRVNEKGKHGQRGKIKDQKGA
jgi:hypothetical protein